MPAPLCRPRIDQDADSVPRLSGEPVARLRPTGQDDRVEVLYWSLWKE
jgi:hypothetical protein